MPSLEQGPNFKQFMAEWNAEHPEGDEKPAEAKKTEKPAHDEKAVEEAFFEAGNIHEAAAKLDLEKTRAKLRQSGQKESPNTPALMADRKAMSALKPDETVLKESKGFFARMLEKVGIKQKTLEEAEAEQTFKSLEKAAPWQKKADYQAEVGGVEAMGQKGRKELREQMDKEAEEKRIKNLLAAEGRRGTPESSKHAEF